MTLSVPVGESPDRVEKLCAAIARSGGRLDLPAAAKELGVGRDELRKVLRAEVGMNYRDFRKRVKVRIAAALLADPNLTIDEVAERSGYEYRSTFDRIFSEVMGISAARYRQGPAQAINLPGSGDRTPRPGRL